MKKGISIWAFGDLPLCEAAAMAKAAGFDGIELALAETGELHTGCSKEEILKIKSIMERSGLSVYSLATGLFWQYSLTSADPAVREKAEAIAKKLIETAAWLGCDTVLVVPGTVDETVPYDVAYDRALDAVKRLAPFAEEHKVVVGIENVWNKMLLSPLEMRDFIDAAGSAFVQAYFDVGNVIRDGYPEHWIRILGGRIAKVHFKDYERAAGTLAGFGDLLKGDVNYPAVMAALADAGYDGWVTAELFPGADTDLPAWIGEVSRAMDFILGRPSL